MTKLNDFALSARVLGAASPSPWAPPRHRRMHSRTVQFSFVGEITGTVLRDGLSTPYPNDMPASWAGGRVSGVLSLDVDRAAVGTSDPQGYAYADDTVGSDWISVAVRNPDGSLFELPAPLPSVDGAIDVARATLNTGNDQGGGPVQPGFFQIERSLCCSAGAQQQAFALDLGSRIGSPTWTPANAGPTLDIATTQVDVAFANRTNTGLVRHRPAPDEGYEYAFSFLSVTHMAPVAEPGEWATLACGLGLVGWARRRP